MNRKEALEMLMLLSALESWSFSTGKMLPDYLHDNLLHSINLLCKIITGECED